GPVRLCLQLERVSRFIKDKNRDVMQTKICACQFGKFREQLLNIQHLAHLLCYFCSNAQVAGACSDTFFQRVDQLLEFFTLSEKFVQQVRADGDQNEHAHCKADDGEKCVSIGVIGG